MQELIGSQVGQDHFDIVVQAMAEGMVVPLLGAGVNLNVLAPERAAELLRD